MKFSGVRWLRHSLAGVVVLSAFLFLEFYTNLFEKSVGYYLKWQNHKRPQLGRMWERDRQSLIAQAQIQSIRSSLDIQEENARGISSLKELFENFKSKTKVGTKDEDTSKLLKQAPYWASFQ